MSDTDELLRLLLLYFVAFTTQEDMRFTGLFLFYRLFYATKEAQPAFCLRFSHIIIIKTLFFCRNCNQHNYFQYRTPSIT